MATTPPWSRPLRVLNPFPQNNNKKMRDKSQTAPLIQRGLVDQTDRHFRLPTHHHSPIRKTHSAQCQCAATGPAAKSIWAASTGDFRATPEFAGSPNDQSWPAGIPSWSHSGTVPAATLSWSPPRAASPSRSCSGPGAADISAPSCCQSACTALINNYEQSSHWN